MWDLTEVVVVVRSFPHTVTRPPSAANTPAIIRMVVVLPAPFGPKSP